MAPKTRLDALVKLRERVEDQAKIALAQARQKTQKAEELLKQAQARAAIDHRVAGTAALWQDAESARVRALAEVKRAREGCQAARDAEEKQRRAFELAHRDAEAVRRAAESKRQEIVKAAERAERKQFDELAAIQFGRRDKAG